MPNFTVDTHLFRELGELLVGRDSTALVELIKNSYDADATQVTVYGEGLDNPDTGRIVISDNGIGMGPDQFNNGFLRVASRMKSDGVIVSPKFGRRYTGAKGIGRLAAHKLSRLININSVPSIELFDNPQSIIGSIDWDIVESYRTLDEIENSGAIKLRSNNQSNNQISGTSISLNRLRRRWTPSERTRFFAEVTNFTPPKSLTNIVPGIVQNIVLFKEPVVRDSNAVDPGFNIHLQGDFEVGEDYWQSLARTASWVLEIDARSCSENNTHMIQYSISPTKRVLEKYPESEQKIYITEHPDPKNGPFFQARILVREGVSKGPDSIPRSWISRSSGIRVFMEGFRVLPYGEPNNDWLNIDYSYAQRDKNYNYLDEIFHSMTTKDEGLSALRTTGYFGAVFLTANGAPDLRMLVNREGFIPEASYDLLVKLVRTGVDLLTRVRAQVSSWPKESQAACLHSLVYVVQ